MKQGTNGLYIRVTRNLHSGTVVIETATDSNIQMPIVLSTMTEETNFSSIFFGMK